MIIVSKHILSELWDKPRVINKKCQEELSFIKCQLPAIINIGIE
jgi:hypothetical protein